jgi:hypothetical protein
MTINILYGIRSTDLEQIKQQLEIALGVEFQRHESDYRGGDYFRCEESSLGRLILQRNIDLIDGVPAVEKLSQWPIVLHVVPTSKCKQHRKVLDASDFEFDLIEIEM